MKVEEKTAYEKLSDLHEKVLTIFEYYDYAMLQPEKDEKGRLIKDSHGAIQFSQTILGNSNVRYGALIKDYRTVDEQLEAIRARVKNETIADVVGVNVFQIFVVEKGYEDLKKTYPEVSEENVILSIYRDNLFTGKLVSRGFFPMVFKDRVESHKFSC